jgi:MFS family permease
VKTISSPGFSNVWVLTLSNALAASIMTLMILVGSLVGAELAPSAKWATLPIALTVIGTAISILPVTACMQFIGRKYALWAFMAIGIFACWLASSALEQQSFTVFCISAVLLGSTNAALQQTRFAAMEAVAPEAGPTAASLMMCGGILAAIIGPELAVAGAHLTAVDYQGSYWLAAATVVLGAISLIFYKPAEVGEVKRSHSASSTLSIIRNPTFVLAVTSGAVGFVVMSFVMTATPISMHHTYGHSLVDTKWVIQSHIAAMFLPSLITPLLFKQLGIKGMMTAGLACYCGTIGIGYFDISVSGFWLQLVLLGIGWNFLFVSGTALLPRTYQKQDKFKGQAINDLTVFTFQALASLSAGWALGFINWQQMLLLCLLPILMMTVLLLVEGRGPNQSPR